jgi:lipoprotein-releasing system ATP-binding protein
MNNPAKNSQAVINADSIIKNFLDANGADLKVLDGCSLEVKAGEILAIVGASGSGKSTLMHILGGLDRPSSGSVSIDGQDLAVLDDRAVTHLRNHKLGFVYQFHHLLAEFNAIENIAMPLLLRRVDRHAAFAAAEQGLAKVGLSARASHAPGQLSGGERQRVAIARALVTRPLCVLADEPSGNLDRKSAQMVFDLMRQLNTDLGTAFVLVTHDMQIAHQTDRVLNMQDGRLVGVNR